MTSIYPCWVVIPNWNLKDYLINCISSVLKMNTKGELQIVVVDNGSTDGSLSVLDGFEGVNKMSLDRNYGFSYAANKGIQKALDAGARSVFLLNNDTIVDSDILLHFEDAFLQTKVFNSGIFAPVIYYDQDYRDVWFFGSNDIKVLNIPYKVMPRHDKSIVSLDYVTGCGMLVLDRVFYSIGLLDEDFYMYYEDAEFCWRARRAGFKIFGVTNARMIHYVSRSAALSDTAKSFWQHYGRVLFYRKRSSWLNQPFAHLLIFLKLMSFTLNNLLLDTYSVRSAWKAAYQAYKVRT